MPDILDRIRSIFVDDYVDAVQKTSKASVVFLDPNKFDMKAIDAAAKAVDASKPETVQNFQKVVADQVRAQMEEQKPGITDGMSNSDLANIGGASLTQGIFSLRGEHYGKDVCFVNKPKGNENDKIEFFVAMTGMDKKKVGDIPGWQDHWERAWGIHEGAHCNQDKLDVTRSDIDLQRLKAETGSDREMIQWMRDNKLDKMAQTFIDLRSINAFMGDDHHATTPFLKPGDKTEPTQAHFDAAQQFRQAVMEGVSKELGLTLSQTQTLFRDDPRKFIDTVDKLLKEDKIAKTRPVTFDERTDLLAKEMGVKREDVYSADTDVFDKAYAKLEKEGAFIKPQDNPHVKEYAQSFADAYRRQVVDRPEPVAPKRRFGPRADAGDVAAPEEGATRLAAAEKPEKQDVAVLKTADVSAATGFGRYDYLADKEVGGGEPIIVHGEVRSEMKIGGVEPREFFAVQADRALAEQRIEAQARMSTPIVAQENTSRYTAAAPV